MSLHQIYSDTQAAIDNQKYKIATDMININTRCGGLITEATSMKDTLINIKEQSAAILDAGEIAELDVVIARASKIGNCEA